jgi:folate-binding protein YgfZ
VAVLADLTVWLLRDDAPAAELAEHLERHIFREDARVADAGAGYAVRAVEGGFDLTPGTLDEEGGVPRRLQLAPGFGLAVEPGAPLPPSAADERARIESGRPRHGHEIHLDFNPFEVGLAHEVHLSKGCFTGQEALMRLVTYQSVRRRLVRLEAAGGPPPHRDLMLEGRPVGRLTSLIERPGGWVGLAVIRSDAIEGKPEIAGAVLAAIETFPETRPLGLP